MTIPAHSHADSAFENQSRDNASEATGDSRPSSKQDMDGGSTSLAPPPPKIFTRRKRELCREGPVRSKPTAEAQQSAPALTWISQARRSAFEEICAFDLLPAETVKNCDDDSRWTQVWNAVTAENSIDTK